MSVAQSHARTVRLLPTADADLLTRLRIALSTHRRAGWHLVSFTAQNGVVQLAGIVCTRSPVSEREPFQDRLGVAIQMLLPGNAEIIGHGQRAE